MSKAPKDIDDYIARFPPEVQKRLRKIRTTIRKAVPEAEEAIKYEIPTFVLNGNLVHFAAYPHHISVYPAPRGSEEFKDELAGYKGGKGTVQFPLDEPLPVDLIVRIVKHLVARSRERAEARRKKR